MKVTFTNVRKFEDLGDKITVNLGVTTPEFNEAIDKFIETNQEGFNKDNILSMFIPNTYNMYFNVVPDDVVGRFNKEYHDFWTVERLDKARALGLTRLRFQSWLPLYKLR